MSQGRELGDYRLGRRIAIGGMAEIFEAERRDAQGPPLVVKLLLPQYASDPEVVRMLEHEGELVRGLSHEALVRVVEVVSGGEEPFLVLERVDGASLDVLLARMREHDERCTVPMALAIALPLLDALAYVHDARDEAGEPLEIVHRDVTPHNVLVARDGTVKLGDFGIARSSLRDARTRTGMIKGKLRYLAPEQATGSALDARTDVYAAAAILWELLAGEPYLEGQSEIELLRAAEHPPARPLPPREPTGPSELERKLGRALARGLARFPEQRIKSAGELRDALKELASDADLQAGREAWARLVASHAPPSQRAAPAHLARGERAWEAGSATSAAPTSAMPSLVRWFGLGAIVTVTLVAVYLVSQPGQVARDVPRAATRASAPTSPRRAEPTAPLAPVEPPPAPAEPIVAESEPIEPPEAPSIEPSRPVAPRVRPSAPATTPDPAPVDDGLARAREAREALARDLSSQGILPSDLSAAQRAGLARVDAALGRGDASAAQRELDAVAPSVRAVEVNEAFVRAKLERVDARIRAARAAGTDTAEIERLSALALQDLLERRVESTNQRLNTILARLRER